MRTIRAAIAAIPVLLGVAVVAAPAAADAGCSDTRVFEVGGMWDPDAKAYDGANAKLPAGVDAHQIHYPAQIWPMPKAQPGTPGGTEESEYTLDESVKMGMDALRGAVRQFHASCPGSHLLISGYSEGALVAGNILNELSTDSAIPHDQIDGVLYADARRPAASGSAGGVETNLPTFMNGMTMQGPRGFGDIAVHEICNQNDGICNSPNPFTNLLAFANSVAGYLSGAHGYTIDPLGDRGNGDTVNPQAPIVQYGPPLPLPIPTPYEMFNGKMPTEQVTQIVSAIADLVYGALPAAEQKKFDQLRALPHHRADAKTTRALGDLVGSQRGTDHADRTDRAITALHQLIDQLPERQADRAVEQLPKKLTRR